MRHESRASTYLHASELGLEESMQRFDASRGKPVARAELREPWPDGRDEPLEASKDLLHWDFHATRARSSGG